MTEQDAIEIIKLMGTTYKPAVVQEALDMAVAALSEVQEYRKIGTVEQVQNQKHNLGVAYNIIDEYTSVGTVEECRITAKEKTVSLQAYVEQLRWERDTASQQLKEIGITIGQKMDTVRKALEKQKEKTGKIGEDDHDFYICPNCGAENGGVK